MVDPVRVRYSNRSCCMDDRVVYHHYGWLPLTLQVCMRGVVWRLLLVTHLINWSPQLPSAAVTHTGTSGGRAGVIVLFVSWIWEGLLLSHQLIAATCACSSLIYPHICQNTNWHICSSSMVMPVCAESLTRDCIDHFRQYFPLVRTKGALLIFCMSSVAESVAWTILAVCKNNFGKSAFSSINLHSFEYLLGIKLRNQEGTELFLENYYFICCAD